MIQRSADVTKLIYKEDVEKIKKMWKEEEMKKSGLNT
jgi:hypothetical protein